MDVVRKLHIESDDNRYGREPVSKGISARTLVDFVLRQWRLILLVAILVICAAAVYLQMTPPRFTATTDMLIDTKRITFTQAEMATDNRIVDDASVESEIETTRSERVLLAVVERLKLYEDAEFIGAGRQLTRQLLSLFSPKSNAPAPASPKIELSRQALDVLKSNLRVARLGRSYVEQISYTSLDPNKAATIANAVADAYIEDQLEAKFDATRRASVWLQNRIVELRQQASDAFKAVQDYKSDNNIIIGADGKLASEVELEQLGTALARARSDTTQAQAKVDRITRIFEQRNDKEQINLPDPVVIDAMNNPVITRLRQQFLDNQSKENEWSSRYGPDHLAAKNLRGEMLSIQRAIWDEVGRIAESYRSDLQVAKTQEAAIDRRMSEVFQQSSTTRQSQVKLRELETASNIYRTIYETFLNRYTQAVQQQSFPSTEARIVTLATPPRGKSSPKVSLTLAFAGLCGLGLGVMAALMREQLNKSIHTRQQVEELLATSCLAVLPKVDQGRLATSDKRNPAMRTQHLLGSDRPFSPEAEALRYIKVAVDLSPKGPKVIGFISALPGEGKTTVAASMAAALAKAGSRTLLIDGDLRKAALSKALGHSSVAGITVLVGKQKAPEKIIITDSRYKFDFLSAASRTRIANSAELLTSPIVENMLKKAKSDYDYVIVDLPPILPIVDVQASAHLFDAFVMVVEWGSTSVDEVRKAMSASPVVAERLLGVVLNKADEAAMRRIEGYSDRRYSYYSDEVDAKPAS